MRQQAFLLVAAVSLFYSTTAQQTHFFPKLSLVRTYDVSNFNKSIPTSYVSQGKEKNKPAVHHYQIAPQLQIKTLHQQLGSDLRYLKMEQRNQTMQGIFQGLMQGAVYKGKPGM